ncbi:porin family protein [Reichenbachiella sp. MALMAid0571]|uniref:porin family protein n=1 Tax=Reichenbachiella sp. MALMAid0571 TaxID=3143939 RepID=UPI0032DEB474
MLNKRLLLFLCILFCVVFHSRAQFNLKKQSTVSEGINYSLLLNQAEDDFEKGNLSRIPGNLEKGFVKNGFSKEEVIRARRLLTMVYLFSDNEPAAEEELILLLKADPEHPINPLTDPAEFQYLYQKFRTKPIFRVALNFGFNQSRVNVMDLFATTNTNNSDEVFTPKIGLQYGLSIEREFGFKGLEVSLGALYTGKKYALSDVIITEDIGLDTENAFSTMEQVDAAIYLDIPLYLRYNINISGSKFVPFVYLGAEANILFSASRTDGSRTGAQSITASTQDLKASEERNKQSYSLIGGVGFKYKLKTNFFKFEAKYSNGQTNLVNPENRYSNQTTVFRLAHVDNNQSIDLISVNFGYVMSIYNPKKLKKYRN